MVLFMRLVLVSGFYKRIRLSVLADAEPEIELGILWLEGKPTLPTIRSYFSLCWQWLLLLLERSIVILFDNLFYNNNINNNIIIITNGHLIEKWLEGASSLPWCAAAANG